MCLKINLPDDAEPALREAFGLALDRAALEALAIEGYRSGKFGSGQVARVLGLPTRSDAQAWLSSRGVYFNYTIEDLEHDRAALDELFGKSR